MSGFLRLPQATSRAWQKADFSSRPSEAFRVRFSLLQAGALEQLWRQFLHWRRQIAPSPADFDNFEKYLREQRDKAAQALADFPCQLPNARKGEFYNVTITLPANIQITEIKPPRGFGLLAVKAPSVRNSMSIVGVPPKSGEADILFRYIWPGFSQLHSPHFGKFRLTINPDPRELWQNIPSDPRSEYFKSDSDGLMFRAGGRLMLAGSLRGRAHAHRGLARDDDFSLGWNEATKWHWLAVADGAGSAPYARRGSELACSASGRFLGENLGRSEELEQILAGVQSPNLDSSLLAALKRIGYALLPGAALAAYKAIRAEAAATGRQPRDYATTLLLAAAKFYPAGCAIFSFQIGDGCMGAISGEDGALRASPLAAPDEGEYAGQTRFLTMAEMFEPQNLMDRLRFGIFPRLRALLLMTDGVSDARFPAQAHLRDTERWLGLWREIERGARGENPVENLLAWLAFWSPGNHDDRTLAFLEG